MYKERQGWALNSVDITYIRLFESLGWGIGCTVSAVFGVQGLEVLGSSSFYGFGGVGCRDSTTVLWFQGFKCPNNSHDRQGLASTDMILPSGHCTLQTGAMLHADAERIVMLSDVAVKGS